MLKGIDLLEALRVTPAQSECKLIAQCGSCSVISLVPEGVGWSRSVQRDSRVWRKAARLTRCAVQFGNVRAALNIQMCWFAPFAGGDAKAVLPANLPEPAWPSPVCVICFQGHSSHPLALRAVNDRHPVCDSVWLWVGLNFVSEAPPWISEQECSVPE